MFNSTFVHLPVTTLRKMVKGLSGPKLRKNTIRLLLLLIYSFIMDGKILLNPLTAAGVLRALLDFTLTPDDFTRQWGTPWK